MIFVDAHVHIYDCFDIDFFLDSAWDNFRECTEQYAGKEKPSAYVLLLAASRKEKWLQALLDKIEESDQDPGKITSGWQYSSCSGEGAFILSRRDRPQEKLHLVAGRQIVTRERIEVLALFCTRNIADGMTFSQTMEAVWKADAIPVLPWGVGKWFGRRGRMIRDFLREAKQNIFLGDNGGRPRIWPTPDLFSVAREKSVSVLPGSDPLPLPHEAARVGRFGFSLDGKEHENDPLPYLKSVLQSGSPSITPYGRLQGNWAFLVNQIRLKVFHEA